MGWGRGVESVWGGCGVGQWAWEWTYGDRLVELGSLVETFAQLGQVATSRNESHTEFTLEHERRFHDEVVGPD